MSDHLNISEMDFDLKEELKVVNVILQPVSNQHTDELSSEFIGMCRARRGNGPL